jgi:bifunctional DNase/RNase
MRVLGLTLDETNHAPILLLQEEAGQELLPIWIGPLEAMAIAVVLGNTPMPMGRPLTHDLFINLLHCLKARLSGVELVDLREGAYYADLVLLLENGTTHRLDCRPSDAVALALRAQAPIRASKALVRMHTDKAFHARIEQGAEHDRLAELLRSLEPESKRKM